MMRKISLLLVFPSMAAISCQGPSYTGSPIRVDPEDISREPGSIEELREVSRKAVEDFLNCSRIDLNKNYRVVLHQIENSTRIRGYDERVLYNRLLAELVNSGGDRFTFLNRDAVVGERELQNRGEVEATPGAAKPLSGADLLLSVDILRLSGRSTVTIQYSFRLTELDGAILCISTQEMKKQL